MSVQSQGHPPVPAEVSAKDVVAIVSVHHPQASNVNRDTPFPKTRLTGQQAKGTNRRNNEGCHIFLHRVEGQSCYSFGRGDTKTPGSSTMDTRDVYFPGTQVGMKQFVLTPIWDSDIWRLQSTTETVATVNNVPIQAFTNRTKKNRDPLPHAIHLNPSTVNQITINGLRVDIWLLQSVREVYPTKEFDHQALQFHLQNVSHRPEQWARDRYILSSEQVSKNSFRVVQRFTSAVQTAKLFRDEQNGRRLRDEEFLKFGKEAVDASIVQYRQSLEINNIPAVITSTYDGFASYAALQADIKEQHPGLRFSIATKMLRRVFFALEFLHFHGIIHGNVTQESVLLRLKDYRPEAVLLVDYSNSTSFTTGAQAPLDEMIRDGQAAMQVIEDCCDIWHLRKAATKDAQNEEWMAKKTMTAQKEHQIVQRVLTDFQRQGGLRTSEKGKKLVRLLEHKNHNWHRCQDDQFHNATRREVGVCYKSNIDEMANDWNNSHPPAKIGDEHFFVLSLGHPWFDQLASQLYHGRWDTTPHDVCARFSELAGNVEEPWQTFVVKKILVFLQNDAGFDEKCVMAWLAGWSEAFPEWRRALDIECELHIRPKDSTVTSADIGKLRHGLSKYGRLAQSVVTTFNRLMEQDDERTALRIEETYDISLHTPSRMFNLTQLQRLASPDRFVLCVNDGRIRCDNYAEVRGEPELQGCYAPLSLLQDFAEQLGLTVPHNPDHTPLFPTFDPSDFSQVSSGRIVLARTGLVAYASITRTGNQCVFHAPKYPEDFAESSVFLPTYFGDMKVLPQLPEGIYEYARPDHWSKFKTAEEIEDAANVGQRKILQPKGPLKKMTAKSRTARKASSPALSTVMEVDETALSRVLKQRQQIRSQARPPVKRNTDAQASHPGTPTAKRSRMSLHAATPHVAPKVPGISMSFINRAAERMERMAEDPSRGPSFTVPRIPNSSFFQRNGNVNANLLSSPPRLPADKNQSFTVAVGSFNLEDDWKQADEWLKQMPDDEEDEPQVQGIFGFRFHHSHLQEGSETEEESPPESDEAKREEKNKNKAANGAATSMRKGEQNTSSRTFADGLPSFGLVENATPTANNKVQTPSQSFTNGQPSRTASKPATPESKGKGKVTAPSMDPFPFKSFVRQPKARKITPKQKSPASRPTPAATARPLDLGSSHRPDVSISSLTDVSLGRNKPQATPLSSAQPAPHTPTQQPVAPSPAKPALTASALGAHTRIYGKTKGAMEGWLDDQVNAVQGGGDDDDMPDTDVESWDGEDREE